MNDNSSFQPLYISFGNRKYVRANCSQCEARFKVSREQDKKRVRCPDCLQAHVVIAEQKAAVSTSSWRSRIWGMVFVVASFVGGYFVGRMHFKYLVIETLKDMQLNP